MRDVDVSEQFYFTKKCKTLHRPAMEKLAKLCMRNLTRLDSGARRLGFHDASITTTFPNSIEADGGIAFQTAFSSLSRGDSIDARRIHRTPFAEAMCCS